MKNMDRDWNPSGTNKKPDMIIRIEVKWLMLLIQGCSTYTVVHSEKIFKSLDFYVSSDSLGRSSLQV